MLHRSSHPSYLKHPKTKYIQIYCNELAQSPPCSLDPRNIIPPPPPTTPRVCADDPVQTPCTVGSLKGRPSQPGGLSGSPGPFAHGGTGSGLRNGLWSPCLRLLRGPADPSLTNLGAVLRVQDKNRKQTTGSVSNSKRIQNTSMFLGCFLNAFLHHILILVLESARLWFKNLPP